MGGGMLDDWEFTPSAKNVSTIVLLGKAGTGKSATGNSILGREAFESDDCFAGVTSTCELQSTELKDGRTLHVIDTPGLFDFNTSSEIVGKEIVNCINLAKDGIHAVLMVFSVTTRFSDHEVVAIESMKSFFGERIVDYMIIIFTGGDSLERKGRTLSDYIKRSCPEPIKDLLHLCKNRAMLFNNITQDKTKQSKQVDQLLSLVDSVVASNGGKPFTDEIFKELKKEALMLKNKEKEVEAMQGHSEKDLSELKEQLRKDYDDRIQKLTEMIERRLDESNEFIKRLEKQLLEVQAAEKGAQEQIDQLREQLRKAKEENEEIRKHALSKCAIL